MKQKNRIGILQSIRARLYLVDRELDTEIRYVKIHMECLDTPTLQELEVCLNQFQSEVQRKIDNGAKDRLINQWNETLYKLKSMEKS